MVSAPPLLSCEGVAKRFPNGTVALKGVDMTIRAGRVHGLLGANGAGKSTLIKILSGAHFASGGQLVWRGDAVRWRRPIDAKRAGVATIQQHVPLVPTLSVLENILLDTGGWWRRRRDERQRIAGLINRIGVGLDLDGSVGDLAIGERQMVAIVQALASGADLVVMDEPTASLAARERETVYRIVRQLARDESKAVLFVSHFLDEIVALTDEVTVLRDGRAALHAETASLDEAGLAAAIVGKEVVQLAREHRRPVAGTEVVAITRLSSPGRLAPTDLRLRAGEVIGLAGMLGAGRSELLHAIFGADPQAVGSVSIHGKPVGRTPEDAVRAGIALVPEDRVAQGYLPQMPLWQNVTLPQLASHSIWGLIPRPTDERARAAEAVDRLGIRAPDVDALVPELSGGNAQKVTIAKWLAAGTRLLLLDEPTAGIDVGARTDILRLVRALADDGLPVIMASSDYKELLAICDRILVLRDGEVVAERNADELDEAMLVLLTGGAPVPTPSVQPRPLP